VKTPKKVYYTLILSLILTILLSSCGIFDLDGWITPNDAEFRALIKELNTPEKIGKYMLENFTYKPYNWISLTPYELYIRKKGDCNDFSNFGVFIADYHDYITYQIKIFDNTLYTHYVAVYNENIWYSITDGRYYYFGFDSFKEIVEYVCNIRLKTWSKYIVYDYWNDEVEIGYNN